MGTPLGDEIDDLRQQLAAVTAERDAALEQVRRLRIEHDAAARFVACIEAEEGHLKVRDFAAAAMENEKHEGLYLRWRAALRESEQAQPSRRDTILQAIAEERQRQEQKWGNEHDDEHNKEDWLYIIKDYCSQRPHNRASFWHLMVKVGALAIAAIEWADRRESGQAKE